MSESWVEKHRPETFEEVQGNNKSIKQIEEWAKNWSEGDKPQLLVGDPGTGKTSTAHIVADTMGYPINEINTSESRKSDDIQRMADSMKSTPVGSDYQVVLLDEVDSWHHASNKRPLYKALKNPKNPVILTSNDKYSVPQSIKNASKIHDFKLGKRSIKSKLKDIAEKEGVELSKTELNELSGRPDLRTAINDLQVFSITDGFPDQDTRVWDESEFSAIQSLLGGENEEWRKAMGVRSNTFGDPGSALLWLDENLSSDYRLLEQGVAYDALSRADIQLGRAESDSAYRFWKFASAILENIPETRLSEPYGGYIRASFPEWFRSKQKKYDKDTPEAKLFRSLKGEMSFGFAASYREFRKEILPILRSMEIEERYELALNHGLDDDTVEALGIDPENYREHREIEAPEEGDGWSPDTQEASVTSW